MAQAEWHAALCVSATFKKSAAIISGCINNKNLPCDFWWLLSGIGSKFDNSFKLRVVNNTGFYGGHELKIRTIAFTAISFVAFSAPAHADITGNINATIELTPACRINNVVTAEGGTGAVMGTIDFDQQNTYFVTADAQLVGSEGSGIVVQCSNGITPTLAFSGGDHDGAGVGAGVRAMQHTSDTGQYVTYDLYSDFAGGTVIPVDGEIELLDDGTVQTVPVFGRAFGADGLITGVYDDVVVVTISFT